MTAVEYIEEYLISKGLIINDKTTPQVLVGVLNEAREMENKNKLRNQLFIGKIHEVLGYDKTIELLKECYAEYPL